MNPVTRRAAGPGRGMLLAVVPLLLFSCAVIRPPARLQVVRKIVLPTGLAADRLGVSGSPEQGLLAPGTDLYLTDDFMLVGDPRNGVIRKYDKHGRQVSVLDPGPHRQPGLFTVDRSGMLYVHHTLGSFTNAWYRSEIRKYDTRGAFVKVLSGFTGFPDHLSANSFNYISLVYRTPEGNQAVERYVQDRLMHRKVFSNSRYGPLTGVHLLDNDNKALLEYNAGGEQAVYRLYDLLTGRDTGELDIPSSLTPDHWLFTADRNDRLYFWRNIRHDRVLVAVLSVNSRGECAFLRTVSWSFGPGRDQGKLLEAGIDRDGRFFQTRMSGTNFIILLFE